MTRNMVDKARWYTDRGKDRGKQGKNRGKER